MIRVLIADDHTIVREGLRQLLEAAGDFEVVGDAADAVEAIQLARKVDFDVAVLDISMPGRSGIELIKQIRTERPRARIMMLSMHEQHEYAVRAMRAGASGYLTKDSAARELASALRKIAAGGAYVSAEVAEQLALGAMPQADTAPHTLLSDREFQVLQSLVAGKTVSEIAEALSLSVKTVSTHKARLMEKIGAENNVGLFRYAMRHGLIES
ncbi:MAG TPA: response regulator transcription factor [Casimicrobiaceae bacterium]|nr:response regulator transcription factor [Casimicrobiaceae bacterium]